MNKAEQLLKTPSVAVVITFPCQVPTKMEADGFIKWLDTLVERYNGVSRAPIDYDIVNYDGVRIMVKNGVPGEGGEDV